jgi:hypothetical protein
MPLIQRDFFFCIWQYWNNLDALHEICFNVSLQCKLTYIYIYMCVCVWVDRTV